MTKIPRRTALYILIPGFHRRCLTRRQPTSWGSAPSSESACGRSSPRIGRRLAHFSRRSRSFRLGTRRHSRPLARSAGKRWRTSASRLKRRSRPSSGRRARRWRLRTWPFPMLRRAAHDARVALGMGLLGMGLSEQQRADLREIEAEYFDKPEQIYRELTDKALAAFTPAQQEVLRAEVDRRGW